MDPHHKADKIKGREDIRPTDKIPTYIGPQLLSKFHILHHFTAIAKMNDSQFQIFETQPMDPLPNTLCTELRNQIV